MPKQKTRSAAKKRFKLKKSGVIKRNKMNHRHILTKKSPKRKRNLRKSALVSSADYKNIKELIS